MAIRFRIRTILIVVGLVAFSCACWVWTNTFGVQQLRAKYDTDTRERLQIGLAEDDAGLSVEEYLERNDTSSFFKNPVAIFPFIITVYSDEALDAHYALRTETATKRTHFWFFGYVSEAL